MSNKEKSLTREAFVYVVMADYGYEGHQAVRVFMGEEAANNWCEKINEYHNKQPDPYDRENYKRLRKEWDKHHPAPMNTACDKFEVAEVPFSLPGKQ